MFSFHLKFMLFLLFIAGTFYADVIIPLCCVARVILIWCLSLVLLLLKVRSSTALFTFSLWSWVRQIKIDL